MFEQTNSEGNSEWKSTGCQNGWNRRKDDERKQQHLLAFWDFCWTCSKETGHIPPGEIVPVLSSLVLREEWKVECREKRWFEFFICSTLHLYFPFSFDDPPLSAVYFPYLF
jgi:hypothetical protein